MSMVLSYLFQGHPEAAPLNPITRYIWIFPFVESIHICGFALLVGTVLILDMRLLGVFFPRQPVSVVAKQLAPWIYTGIAMQLITGPYLFSSDASDYVQVPAFLVKMVLLVLALLFHFTVIRKATEPSGDSAPLGWRKPAACVSLALWLSVVLGGLWIGNL
jgi:hypothetical protein